jgi:hypothetical protein
MLLSVRARQNYMLTNDLKKNYVDELDVKLHMTSLHWF